MSVIYKRLIHEIFNSKNCASKNNTIEKMNIFSNNKITYNSDFAKLRNSCQHFQIILDKWVLQDKNKSQLSTFLNQFNNQYKHTFSLEILSLVLEVFTTDCDIFSLTLLKKCAWLFQNSANIFENSDFMQNHPKLLEELEKYKKIIKLDYYQEAMSLYQKHNSTQNKSEDEKRHIYKKEAKSIKSYI